LGSAATVRVLVRNLASDVDLLQFSTFLVEKISNGLRCEDARKFFPEAYQNEWILTREYDAIPSTADGGIGYGDIPFDVEDMLLLLRLYKPGDVAFAAIRISTADGSVKQHPYRAISNLVSNHSLRPYLLKQEETADWETFESPIRTSPQWKSTWFQVCRRWFLYGGGKEFNPEFEMEVDRVVDYASAVEAALVPEHDFVGRRLRERAIALLKPKDEPEAKDIKHLVREIYGIRSTLVHGSPLSAEQMEFLRCKERWLACEQIVRNILVCALRSVPSEEAERRVYLSGIYDLTNQDRAEKLTADFKAIKDPEARKSLLQQLSTV
jgi:hypothetical protein